MTERALTEFRAAVRAALAAPLDGPLTARFVAPCVTALVVHADAGEELVAGLAEIIAAQGSDIRQLGAEAWNTGRAHIDLTVEVKDRKHWERLEKVLANAPGVLHVERKR